MIHNIRVSHLVLRFVLIAAIGAILGYIGYSVYDRYLAFSAQITRDRERTLEIAQNRSRTAAALQSVGVSLLQAGTGFWYTYTDTHGNQSVGYFNPDTWAMHEQLSDSQIQDLAHLVASSTIADAHAMRDVPQGELPPQLQFHNQLYSNAIAGAFQKTMTALDGAYQAGTATTDELWQLSYMYELQGMYDKRDAVNALNCRQYRQRCAGTIPVMLTGIVVDESDHPVEGAVVSVLDASSTQPARTNASGTYSIKLSALPMQKIRVLATKRNFTNGVASTIVLASGKSTYTLDPIQLTSPIVIVTIDTVKHTVTDPRDAANPDGSFILHATSSTYDIPADAIVDPSGKPYHGQVDVYLYEFTRETVPASLVTLDTFDQVMGYAGNLMRSYGMPYIQFFAEDGEELDVTSAHPMLITYRVAGMKELRENTDSVLPRSLTDTDMEMLVAASRGDPGFPITAEFMVRNQLFTFPPFWVLDRGSGVWDNVGMRVLDSAGTVQAPFYTIKK